MTPGSMMHSSLNHPQGMAPYQRAPLQAVNARYRSDSGPQDHPDVSAAKPSHRADMALHPSMRTAFHAPHDARQGRPSPPERGYPQHQGDSHGYGGGFPHSTPSSSSHPRNYNGGHYSGMMPHIQQHNPMMYPQQHARPFPPYHHHHHGMNHFPFQQQQQMNYQSTPMAHGGHYNRPMRNTPEFSYPGSDNVQHRMHELAMANSHSSDDRNHHLNSPRSPSPPPAPPKHVPSSAPPKIHTEKLQHKNNNNKPQINQRLSLDESFGKTLSDPSSAFAFRTVENSAPPPNGKATPSVQDASLLLGLRSTSASKSPIPRSVPHHDIALDLEEDSSKAVVEQKTPSCTPMIRAIPKDYPKRLATASDKLHLNSLHCYIRAELLELFVIEPGKDDTSNTMTGRIGLQCVHCSAARANDPKRENEATMAVFYPRSCNEIYRLVTNWTRCHLRKCKNLPPSVRKDWDTLRSLDKSRGKTQYWADSARQLGLVDCTQSRAGGVRFRDDFGSQEKAKKGGAR